jgi:hypothetical protein
MNVSRLSEIGVPDQPLVSGIDDEIEQLQGYIADQYRAIISDLGNPHLAIASLDGHFHLFENAKGHRARRGLGLNRLDPLET